MIGEHGTDIAIQTLNGITYYNFYSGIGFGIDYYGYNSLPLFFDQRIFFRSNKNIFVYGDLGYNFSEKNNQGKAIYYYKENHFSGGLYTGAGLGYKIRFFNKSFFNLSAGFSYKEINDKVSISYPCLAGSCPLDYNNYRYSYGRIALKAGVDF